MKAEDKAKELVEKYRFKLNGVLNLGQSDSEATEEAKKCALICVEEIIKVILYLSMEDVRFTLEEETKDYWTEVKTSIEKL